MDDQERLAGEWATFRDNLASWATSAKVGPRLRASTFSVKGAKLPYRLDYAKGLWEKQPLDGYDKRADVVLLGYDPKDKEARRGEYAALVQMLALDKAPDLEAAPKEARDYLLEMEKEKQDGAGEKYNFPEATMEVVNEKSLQNMDVVTNIGGFRGHLFKLEVKKSAERSQVRRDGRCEYGGRWRAGGGLRMRLGAARLLGSGVHALLDKLKSTKAEIARTRRAASSPPVKHNTAGLRAALL